MSFNTTDLRYSDELVRRDIPSFIEPPPPLIQNPFMIPRPEKGINLLEKFDEDVEDIEDVELVQVYLRMKSCNVPSNLYEIRSDKCLITSLDTATAGHGRRTQHNVSKMYSFTRIFQPECSQKEIFEQVVKVNLKKLVDGHSFTLLTYGASGSGKTYTVMGTVNCPGLVPRSLEYLFKLVDAAQTPVYRPSDSGVDQIGVSEQNYELQWVKRIRQLAAPTRDKYRRMSTQLHSDLTASNVDLSNRTKHYVWVSFVEIYNENIYDLLVPTEKRTKLKIREDSSGNVYVKGVTQAFVRSGEEAYDVMVAGKQNLVVAATGVHAQSSRSHCIFTITMLTENNDGKISTSQVRLCDLAGCERQLAAKNTGARMQESRAINSSLHVLERCLHMLRRKQRSTASSKETMVPYRESKLTRLLGSGLSGARGEAVSMVVTLNPAPQHANQSKHVLSLAAVAKDIQVNMTMATTFSSLETTQDSAVYSSDEVMRLRAENERLHFELAQAQNCISKLQWSIDEKQQESANTMREVVEETREAMKNFYESRLAAAEARRRDMEEEYESVIAQQEDLIAKLVTEVEERKLYFIEEYLRERGEIVGEINHTKTESPITAPPQSYIETKNLSSDTSDSEDDLEESLEPGRRQTINAIKKNASRISMVFQKDSPHKSERVKDKEPIIDLDESNDDNSEHETETDTENEREKVNKTEREKVHVAITMEDDFADDEANLNDENDLENEESNISDAPVSKDSLYATGDEDSEIEQTKHDIEEMTTNLAHTTFENNKTALDDDLVNNFEKDRSECEKSFNVSTRVNKTPDLSVASNVRGTYFVSVSKVDKSKEANAPSNIRGTYFVHDSKDSQNSEVHEDVYEIKAVNNLRGSYTVAERDVSFHKEINITDESDSVKEKQTEDSFPREVNITDDSVKEKKAEENKVSPNVNDKSTEKEQITEKQNTGSDFVKPKETIVNKILKSVKSRQSSNSSLKQFEQLESACNAENSPENNKANSTFVSNPLLPTLKEKKSYFDDSMQVEVSDATTENSVKGKTDSNKTAKLFEESLDSVKPSLVCSGKLCLLSSAAKSQEKMLFDKSNNLTSPIKHTMTDDDKTDKDKSLLHTPKPSEAKLYFDDSDKVVTKEVLLAKSPSLVRDDISQDYVPSVAVKKILGQNFAMLEPTHIDVARRHESVDVFESPRVNLVTDKCKDINNIMIDIEPTKEPKEAKDLTNTVQSVKEIARQFVDASLENQIDNNIVIKQENVSLERTSFTQESTESLQNMEDDSKNNCVTDYKDIIPIINVEPPSLNDTPNSNNTIEEFEKIVKDLTNVRATEFDLLLSVTDNNVEPAEIIEQNVNITNKNLKLTEEKDKNQEKSKKNLNTSNNKDETEISERKKKFEEVKYNLRHKEKSVNLVTENEKPTVKKRSLRLRRRQNQETEDDSTKLKDIRNLEKEFSDVTLGIPAAKKVVNDISSPEKVPEEEENLPPMMGIQSCPSKSVTRSRRKLFTPRAEALEESPSQAADSNERVHVPRPSYHRTRARRKL